MILLLFTGVFESLEGLANDPTLFIFIFLIYEIFSQQKLPALSLKCSLRHLLFLLSKCVKLQLNFSSHYIQTFFE